MHPLGKTKRWIKKMNDTFYDRHDELYYHAKFGEDRAMRVGCRCDVVFVFLFVFTGRMPRSGKLPVLNLLRGQKSGFSPRRGESLHRFTSNMAGPTGTWVRLAEQTFTSIATGCGIAAPKYQKFPVFAKESPRRGDSLDRLRKSLGYFIRLPILH